MKWYYESDGDPYHKTHYLCAENIKGKTLKETFLRIDCKSKQQAIKLCINLNKLKGIK